VLVHSDHFDEVVDEAPHRDHAMNADPRAPRYPVRQPRVRREPPFAQLHQHRVTRLFEIAPARERLAHESQSAATIDLGRALR